MKKFEQKIRKIGSDAVRYINENLRPNEVISIPDNKEIEIFYFQTDESNDATGAYINEITKSYNGRNIYLKDTKYDHYTLDQLTNQSCARIADYISKLKDNEKV